MNRRRGASGFTMIELIIAIVISTVVIGAAWKLLTSNQRFYRSQSQIQDVEQNLRAAASVVPGDLRELDAKGGDLIAMYDTMITIRAMRGFGVVCAAPDKANGYITLRNSLLFLPVGLDTTKSVYVFREADSSKNSDDTWQAGSITAVTTLAQTCADLSAGTKLTVSLTNGNTKLDSVFVGAPVRIWQQVAYRLWNDGSGTYWLGGSTYANGAWSSTQPIAGPVSSTKGIQFAYYDSTGAVTTTASSVARITMTVREVSSQNIMVAGRPTGPYQDSITVSATLRNN